MGWRGSRCGLRWRDGEKVRNLDDFRLDGLGRIWAGRDGMGCNGMRWGGVGRDRVDCLNDVRPEGIDNANPVPPVVLVVVFLLLVDVCSTVARDQRRECLGGVRCRCLGGVRCRCLGGVRCSRRICRDWKPLRPITVN